MNVKSILFLSNHFHRITYSCSVENPFSQTMKQIQTESGNTIMKYVDKLYLEEEKIQDGLQVRRATIY